MILRVRNGAEGEQSGAREEPYKSHVLNPPKRITAAGAFSTAAGPPNIAEKIRLGRS